MTTNLTIPRGLALLSIPLACLAAGAPAGSPPETKPYTLFMGADFEVQHQKEFYRAHGVHEGSLVIKVGDKDVLVSMSRGPVNMKVDQELKLTEASATVQELKSERAYTPANDPVRKFRREQTGGASHLQSNAAEIQSFNAQGAANRAQVSGAPAGVVAQVQASAAGASANFSSALAGENSSINDTGAQAGRMQDELAKKLFDAMDVTFQVSSPKPLSSPYVVILAEYREHNEKPGAAHNWIYAQELAPISSEPRKVHILQGGLPQGFELLKLQLHLYNRGRELATNVADKQVALTREEAVQYLLIDYLGSHKGRRCRRPRRWAG